MKKKIPISSYRLQLSKSFDFVKATNLLPYLKKLSIEMVYTSPYFEIVKGSNNPYMIISSTQISEELGGEKAFITFCKACKKHGIIHMMDIVPNHMAADTQNRWWNDVVEKEKESVFAPFFDIDWKWGNGKLIRPGTCFNIHEEINYRRFFDICELVGINIENEALYKLYFSKIFHYVNKGWIEGFRVDHPDGLKDPKAFLDKINKDVPQLYIALEKILQEGELLPLDFKCDGSVGYDILFLIDQVLLDKSGEEKITKLYSKNQEEEVDLAQIKIDYLNKYLLSETNRFTKLFGIEKEELLLFLAHFPIYRTYATMNSLSSEDEKAILEAASFTNTNFFKKDIFQPEHRETLIKLQQILPAVFAKGSEDTYNYRYVRLCSLNEVGGNPTQYGISNNTFHTRLKELHRHFPNTMHTLSTHDTKRSLDARMRIHILSEIPDQYEKQFNFFMKTNPSLKSMRMSYFFFQNLIAISDENLVVRMTDYMIKSSREGKYYSDHLTPNLEYEERLKKWVKEVIENKEFMEHFLPFKEQVAKAALMKSLSALVLQMGLFGVMDIYQGEELENANLVDPDNRRLVDFTLRKELIDTNANIKMSILKKGLEFRKQNRDIILHGTYEPILTEDYQIGYKRVYKNKELAVLVNKYHFDTKKYPQCQVEGSSIFLDSYPFHISVTSCNQKS
ncbi:MAG: Maltooligosyl trehalose synthase [Chlamydiia bacterium]|nr:Maltooligosyl trehalose synthase [Chlamydiia bacterium]